jgi:hypothetical protein
MLPGSSAAASCFCGALHLVVMVPLAQTYAAAVYRLHLHVGAECLFELFMGNFERLDCTRALLRKKSACLLSWRLCVC